VIADSSTRMLFLTFRERRVTCHCSPYSPMGRGGSHPGLRRAARGKCQVDNAVVSFPDEKVRRLGGQCDYRMAPRHNRARGALSAALR
jgi:hypothetical protein